MPYTMRVEEFLSSCKIAKRMLRQVRAVVYAVVVILLSACMLMLSYVIILSCIDAHA